MTVSDAAPTSDAFKGVHPASILVNLVPRAWRVARSAWPLLLAFLYGGTTDRVGIVDLALLLLFFGLTVGSTLIHFFTLRYRVHDGRLEIESGLVQRQIRTIDPHRIQNVEMVRNLFHRWSGLVEVRIETASGTEVEGLLSALTVEDAKELIEALETARRRAAPPVSPDGVSEGGLVVENSMVDLVRHGATATRLGAAAVLLGLILEFSPASGAKQLRFDGAGVAALLPLLLIGAWVLGILASLTRHYGFRLRRGERGLVAEEGLDRKSVV